MIKVELLKLSHAMAQDIRTRNGYIAEFAGDLEHFKKSSIQDTRLWDIYHSDAVLKS